MKVMSSQTSQFIQLNTNIHTKLNQTHAEVLQMDLHHHRCCSSDHLTPTSLPVWQSLHVDWVLLVVLTFDHEDLLTGDRHRVDEVLQDH